MVQGILTVSPVPSCWKIPIPVKVSGLADESICFLIFLEGKEKIIGNVEGDDTRRKSCYRGLEEQLSQYSALCA